MTISSLWSKVKQAGFTVCINLPFVSDYLFDSKIKDKK